MPEKTYKNVLSSLQTPKCMRGNGRIVTQEERVKILELLDDGHPPSEVSSIMNVSYKTVYYTMKTRSEHYVLKGKGHMVNQKCVECKRHLGLVSKEGYCFRCYFDREDLEEVEGLPQPGTPERMKMYQDFYSDQLEVEMSENRSSPFD